MPKLEVLYDVRNSRENPCIPVIEIDGYRFIGEPTRFSTAKRACEKLVGVNVPSKIGKFEFEATEPEAPCEP